MRAFSNFLAATALFATVVTANADAGLNESRLSSAPLDQVTGTYKLRDGRKAEIFALGTRLYVRIGLGPTKELRLEGPDRFTSLDSKLSIQFGPDFDTDRIVLAQDTGAAPQSTIRVASNERTGRGGVD
jgi:hypothetical protein